MAYGLQSQGSREAAFTRSSTTPLGPVAAPGPSDALGPSVLSGSTGSAPCNKTFLMLCVIIGVAVAAGNQQDQQICTWKGSASYSSVLHQMHLTSRLEARVLPGLYPTMSCLVPASCSSSGSSGTSSAPWVRKAPNHLTALGGLCQTFWGFFVVSHTLPFHSGKGKSDLGRIE